MDIRAKWINPNEYDSLFRYVNGASNPLGWHDASKLERDFRVNLETLCNSVAGLVKMESPGYVIPIPSSKVWVIEFAEKLSLRLGRDWEMIACLEKIDLSLKRAKNIHTEYNNIQASQRVNLENRNVVIFDDIIRTGATVASAIDVLSQAGIDRDRIRIVALFDLRMLPLKIERNK